MKLKLKITAFLTALALCLPLAGCTISTPDTVGKIGDIEISSGIYLLCQYQAFSMAQSYATSGQETTNTKKFMKQEITVPGDGDSAADSAAASSTADSTTSSAADSAASSTADSTASSAADSASSSGNTQKVSDYVAEQTLKNLQYYAAVKTRFAALGGQLTDEEISQADATAQSIWDGNSELYAKNGFGLATIKEYEYTLTMADDLLALVYGPDGEQPVSDDALTDYMENQLVYGYSVSVPLYNTTTYAFADESQTTQIENACQAVVDDYNTRRAAHAGDTTDSDTIHNDFYAALLAKLPDVYSVMGNTFDASSLSLSADFYNEETMSYYGEEAAKLRGCAVGDAVSVSYGSYSYELFVCEDPLAVNSLDDVRDTVLQDMKGTELQDSLYDFGADSLENALDASAMKQMPATKIYQASSSTAAQ